MYQCIITIYKLWNSYLKSKKIYCSQNVLLFRGNLNEYDIKKTQINFKQINGSFNSNLVQLETNTPYLTFISIIPALLVPI
jgi:hypothetical protein